MARQDVTCAALVMRLAILGVNDNEQNLRNKVSRGKLTTEFLLQCLSRPGKAPRPTKR